MKWLRGDKSDIQEGWNYALSWRSVANLCSLQGSLQLAISSYLIYFFDRCYDFSSNVVIDRSGMQ